MPALALTTERSYSYVQMVVIQPIRRADVHVSISNQRVDAKMYRVGNR